MAVKAASFLQPVEIGLKFVRPPERSIKFCAFLLFWEVCILILLVFQSFRFSNDELQYFF